MVQPNLCLIERGKTLLIRYLTTQRHSRFGSIAWRKVRIIKPGYGHETDFGKIDDYRKGWWVIQEGKEKFFFTCRIQEIKEVEN